MSKCRYFYPDGKEITKKQEFIDFYSEVYRYENHKQWDLELKMEKLLDPGNIDPLTTKNIADILYWKANRKPPKEEEVEYNIVNRGRTIIVKDDPEELSEMNQFKGVPRNSIDTNSAEPFVRHFATCAYTTKRVIDKDTKETVTNQGIGFVYAVTLLFFATKGAYPIYDRYAHVGLKSAMDGGNPTDEQCKITESYYRNNMFHSPYRKTDDDGKKVLYEPSIERAWEDYLRYKHLLMGEDAFGDVYAKLGTNYRDVDRALWAYGHLFYVS